MKNKELARTVKFVLFSASAGVIELLSEIFFEKVIHLDPWWSYLIALILSVLWNFTFNRRFTFKSAGNVPKAMLLVALFYCAFTPLSTLLVKFLTETLGWSGFWATVVNMALNLVTEYFYDRFVVYRNSMDTNDLAENEKNI